MHVLYFVLFLVATVLFLASAWGTVTRRIHLLSAGMVFFSLVFLVQEFQRMR